MKGNGREKQEKEKEKCYDAIHVVVKSSIVDGTTSDLRRPWVVLAVAPGVVLVRGQSEVGPVGVVVPSSWGMAQHGPLDCYIVLAISICEKEKHALGGLG